MNFWRQVKDGEGHVRYVLATELRTAQDFPSGGKPACAIVRSDGSQLVLSLSVTEARLLARADE